MLNYTCPSTEAEEHQTQNCEVKILHLNIEWFRKSTKTKTWYFQQYYSTACVLRGIWTHHSGRWWFPFLLDLASLELVFVTTYNWGIVDPETSALKKNRGSSWTATILYFELLWINSCWHWPINGPIFFMETSVILKPRKSYYDYTIWQ